MDVDETEVEIQVTPAPDEQPHLLLAAHFQPFPFTPDVRHALLARRTLMSHELLFDHLLEKAAIDAPHALFPPASPDALLDLLDAIAKCPWDALKKSCLHFYLLSYVSAAAAASYATIHALPPQFVHLAHACFLLDAGTPSALAHAVALLADTRIIPDLSSKVLHTLALAPPPSASRLVRTYVRAVQPVLEEFDDLAIYTRALLACSLADAWSFQRTFSETTPLRNHLFRTILDACLIPPNPTVLPHLLSLPLTPFEFSLLHAYALSPPETLTPPAHAILHDLLTVRLLHAGRYSDAIRLERAFDAVVAQSPAKSTTDTTDASALHSAAADRQQMMRDVLAVVPDVQSRELELEMGGGEGDERVGLGGSWESMGMSMSMSVGSEMGMSWENLGASGGGERHRPRVVSRAGRLEGSPGVTPPGHAHAPNLASSGKRREGGAGGFAFTFGTPGGASGGVLPSIPTPGLDESVLGRSTGRGTGAASVLASFGFRAGAGVSSTSFRAGQAQAQAQTQTLNGIIHASESPRKETPLFGRQTQGEIGGRTMFSVSRMRETNGNGGGGGGGSGEGRTLLSTPKLDERRSVEGEATMEDESPAAEDVIMVDSDDPDGFVVRGSGRRRTSFRPFATAYANDDDDGSVGGGEGTTVDPGPNGTHVNGNGGTTLFARGEAQMSRAGRRARHVSPQAGGVVPGAYVSFERGESVEASRPPAAAAAAQQGAHERAHDRATRGPSARASHARTRRAETSQSNANYQLKIPGALFDDADADADTNADTSPQPHAQPQDDETAEEQDNVPSLPSKRGMSRRTTRTTRATRAGSAATDSGDDDDDASKPPKTPLRRSTRLSSAGLSSPEPTSPPSRQHAASKRGSRASATEGTARSTRKRKNANG